MNLKLKVGLASGLDRLGLLTAFRRIQSAKYGIVLAFHRVLPDAEMGDCYDPHVAISASVFEQLLRLLRQEFQIVSLDNLMDRTARLDGRQRVALTFDDGWEDTHSVAYPLMLRYGIPATVFVCSGMLEENKLLPEERFARIWKHCAQTGRIRPLIEDLRKWGVPVSLSVERGKWSQQLKRMPMHTKLLLLDHLEDAYRVQASEKRRFITWEEARQMSRNNISIGSHTVNHCTLSVEQDTTIADELVDSRAAIQKNVGMEATCLAYPNGAYNKRVMQLAEDAGFAHAFTTERGLVGRGTNPFRVPRISMDDLVVTDESAALHAPRVRFHLLHAIPR